MPKSLHFKSAEGERKYTAFGHIHHVFKGHGPYPAVFIAGKRHKVKHSRK